MAGQIIRRSKNSFTVRVFLGRDPRTGKRDYHNETVRTTSKKEAEKVLTALLRKRDMGELLIEPTRMTVREYLEHWLEAAAKPRLAEGTYREYAGILKRYLYDPLGNTRLAKLTPVAIQQVYGEMLGRGLSPRMVRYTHTVFNNALSQAVKWRMLAHNPAHYVDLPKQRRKEMLALSEDEANRFLAKAQGDKHYLLFAVLLGTGLRPSEAVALKWSDFDVAAGALAIQRTWARAAKGFMYQEPKTGRGRRIELPEHLTRLLAEHQESAQGELIFPSDAGTPLNVRNVYQRHFQTIVKRAKLPKKLRLYDLRHTHATLLLLAGVHAKIVSERLGHASIQITLDTYSHVLPGMQKESAAKLDAMLFKRPKEARPERALN